MPKADELNNRTFQDEAKGSRVPCSPCSRVSWASAVPSADW
jgi:hypothetical protein